MIRSKLSLAVMLYLASTAAFAAEATSSTNQSADSTFHHEAEIGFLDTSENSDGLASAKYSYYFQGVKQNDAPYELATFLSQSSVISARYAMTEHQDLYELSGEYVFDSKFFVGGGYSRLSTERNWGPNTDLDTYELKAGYYFNPHAKFTLSYQTNSDSDSEHRSNDVYGDYNRDSSEDYDGFALEYQHYLPFESTSGLMLTATGIYVKTDSKDIKKYDTIYINDADEVVEGVIESTGEQTEKATGLAINADWYITNSWSVGGGYQYLNYDRKSSYSYSQETVDKTSEDNTNYSDSDSRNIYTLNTSYFWHFSKYVSARAAIEQIFIDSDSGTSVGIALNGRF
ncbi:putative porin [Shewanella donghaensis]|uniref:putative porin n=1 Tax=Shewanella donghaensis TaxID=238836 RepID=UPI001183B9B9|nr:putative porin [Shewanella donghaensis]